ncbi:hypothetical protein DID75_01575 [Candidatus Marinamargulisbacteria bacterium SCGC AG-410-N11]|nr:hypothetical protein DID75_01575 [Candidatus Marinamargulisbacteria bacterium SCGC AG-410-N11]
MWGYPVVILCLLCGIFFTVRLGLIQFRCFPHAVALITGKYDNPNETGQITHFQALSAALSGTIGLGNIAGVSIAIAMGGPGAVLWMWIVGIFGMATKYTECYLGTFYREESPDTKEVRGGPMYYITKGLGSNWKPLSIFYAISIILAAVGAGNLFQANQAAQALTTLRIDPIITGLVLFSLAAVVIIGGIKRIGSVASKIVPFMCVVYVLGALGICFMNLDLIPEAFSIIFNDAFSGRAATGGAIGSVIIMGVRRAIFSNEAGLGSASIAHAAVKTNYPIREGIVASLGPLIDTIVVCTATALVIILSGNFGTERYQMTSKSLNHYINFEQNERIGELPSNWSVTNQKIPGESEILRTYKDGGSVLSVNNNSQTTSYTTKPITLTDNAIKLSYFCQEGPMTITILNSNNSPIASVDINPKQQDQIINNTSFIDRVLNTSIIPAQESTGIKTVGFTYANEWKSGVITLDKNIIENLPQSNNQKPMVKLRFTTSNQPTTWLIDRIQSVKEAGGITLTTISFDEFFKGFGSLFITISVFFFAFSTLITWSYYGETAVTYLSGKKYIILYKCLFVGMIIIGSVQNLSVVLNFSDAMLGLIVIPNTIAIVFLSKKVLNATKDYFTKLKNGDIVAYK